MTEEKRTQPQKDFAPEIFKSPYNPQENEQEIYKSWEESGYFNPDVCVEKGVCDKNAESFSMILPPPNVTGTLHMGHAAMIAIEDTLVRFHRLKGKKTLWIPGTDHAAIATQSKVEKEIYKKEKKTRHDLGREELLKRVREFAQNSHDTIIKQLKGTGASLDWSREAFTLDETRHKAVFEAFKKMFDAGLLYRKERIVNWDPKGQTTISDDEIVHQEREAKLYTFKYWADFPISISTTRPETKLGDTAVAVHPEDERYKEYIGKEFSGNFMGADITVRIIADENVDPDFGTGALGVTPAHSHIDYEMAQKHNLPLKQVINEYAKMMIGDEDIVGKKTTVAREIIVEKLKEQGLLEKEEDIVQNVSTAERTGAVVEPLPKLQWWVDTEKEFELQNPKIEGLKKGQKITLKELMRHVVESGQIKIMPDRFNKTYYQWIDNLRPWCISRQIWYGHRIPVWYKGDELKVSLESPGEGWVQDEDTLDTWFSSGLWTFSTLGWPEQTEDLKNYHPTDVLETGYDILFFWVARMILMSGFLLEDIPFRNVYLHGLVRDEKGRKMSKSLGNIIDPLDMANKYGADATRMSLIVGAQPGNDIKLSEHKIKGYKHFSNKLWNVARFVLMYLDPEHITLDRSKYKDSEILKEVAELRGYVDEHMQKFRLDLAAEKLYHFIWDRFAAEIIEESKAVLQGDDDEARQAKAQELYLALYDLLKLLHPFMPFVTELIYQNLPKKEKDFLMVETY